MTAENENFENRAPGSPSRRLPLFIGVGALLLYAITLNHWVSISSLANVARITGWDWHPGWLDWRATPCSPLWLLASAPARLLPEAAQPVFLNALSAVCAALALGLLARSVFLLPQDRTRDQRLRNSNTSSLLEGRFAWAPPLLAALACGLQLTFWSHAVTATGEMLDLLVFATLIWLLLEYRFSRRDSLLNFFALLYGAGVTNNWALIGFFPFFLIAMVWIKGLDFFDWKFIRRFVFWAVPGLLIYFLIPALGALGGGRFLHLLALELLSQERNLLSVPLWAPLLLSVPTILALFFIGIRWPTFQGEMSAIGSAVSNFFFKLVHLLLFAGSLWFFLDIVYSPRALFEHVPFLTFYYLAALSAGYFLGYFLTISLSNASPGWDQSRPFEVFGVRVAMGLAGLGAVAAPIWLASANLPKILVSNRPFLRQYAMTLAESVPASGAIVLSDTHPQLMLVRAALRSLGREDKSIFLETDSLQFSEYLAYLSGRHEAVRNVIGPTTNLPPVLDSITILRLLSLLNRKAALPLQYLHPSFGFYFEQYYMQHYGFGGGLTAYRPGELDTPAPSEQEIAANAAFWKKAQSDFLGDAIKYQDISEDAREVAQASSCSADAWGVELQRLNRMKEAESMFKLALELNPKNYMAKANLQFNARLRERNTQPIDNLALIRDALQLELSWQGILRTEGPSDEPDLVMRYGKAFAENGNYRQAYRLFTRRLALLPQDFEAQVALAKTYVDMRLPDRALIVIRGVDATAASPAEKAELLRVEAISYVIQTNWIAAENLLLEANRSAPKDERRVGLLVEYYRIAGALMLQAQDTQRGREQLRKALGYADNLLAMLKGMNRTGSQDEADALQKKAEIQMQLEDYAAAVGTLDVLLQRQPDNLDGLLSRGRAELKITKFADARRDYEKLDRLLLNRSYIACFGAGEAAYGLKDNKTAIKQYKRCVALAPKQAPEFEEAHKRLASLEALK